jgi:hypothetical protein
MFIRGESVFVAALLDERGNLNFDVPTLEVTKYDLADAMGRRTAC